MDSFIFAIKNKIFETGILIQNFFRNISITPVVLTIALLYIIFMRQWELKKVISFFLIAFVSFILLLYTEAFWVSALEPEARLFAISIGRIIFLTIMAVILIYHAAIKE